MRKFDRRLAWAAAGLVVLALPFLTRSAYHVQLLNVMLLYILLTTGLNLAMGYCGQINLAIAAFYGIGAYTVALLTTHLQTPWPLALLAGVVLAAATGLVVGLPSLKVRSHYLAIVTLGLGESINLLMINWTWLTGGPIGISGIPAPSVLNLAIDSGERFYYFDLAFVTGAVALARVIVRSRIGRAFMAVREDYVAARAMGVNVGTTQLLAFAISAAYAGLAGGLYAQFLSYISPETFAFSQTLFVLTMTLVGGIGTLSGPILGAVVLTALQESLRAIEKFQLVVFGAMVLLTVLFLPTGLAGLGARLGVRLARGPRFGAGAKTVGSEARAGAAEHVESAVIK